MNREELNHIFDHSACLTPKQMKHYVHGDMTNEESHAVEMHLNSCPFCNEAIEGLFEQLEGNAAEMVTELNTDFLKEHFHIHNPQVHLNSMAPAQPVVQAHRRKRPKVQPLWRPSSIAAILLLGLGMFWYLEFGQKMVRQKKLAQQITAPATNQPTNNNTEATEQPATATQVQTAPQPAIQQNKASINGNQNPQVPQPVIVTGKNAAQQEHAAKEQEPSKEEKAKKQDEAVVAAYKVPLVDPYNDSRNASSNKTADEIEKLPARTTNDITATTAAMAPRKENAKLNTSRTVIPGVVMEKDDEVSADELFDQKKYSAALNMYRQDATTGNRGHRQKAAIMMARCYLAMGNKQNAIQVLQSLIDEGGPQKKTAKRMLSELNGDKSE